MAECCKELNGMLRLFDDLGIDSTLLMKVNEDNQRIIKQLSSYNING